MPDIARWRITWSGLGVEAPDDELYRALIGRYSERHRRYHVVRHLDECFDRLDEARGLADRLSEVELALWFHDAVYEVRNTDNVRDEPRRASDRSAPSAPSRCWAAASSSLIAECGRSTMHSTDALNGRG
jgi:predicted metal-dependent HD superfamily phosphohydrolase